MQGDRIINCRADVPLLQKALQLISLADTDDVLVVDMVVWFRCIRGNYICTSKQTVIILSISASCFIPLVKIIEFDKQHSRLDCIKPAVTSYNRMIILGLAAMSPKDTNLLSKLPIICDYHATISIPTKILGGKETQTTKMAHGTSLTALVARSYCLG